VLDKLNKIPKGYSEGIFNEKKYGITKAVFNKGKSIKIYAEKLGGKNLVSLNYYRTSNKEVLKPCEMSEQKVKDFISKVILIK